MKRKSCFRLRRHSGIAKLEVFVNGHRRLVLRRHGRGHVLLRLAAGRRARVKVIVFRSDGTRLITTRTYSFCRTGPTHKRVRKRRRER